MNQSFVPEDGESAGVAAGPGGRAPRDSLFLLASAWFSDHRDQFPLRVRNLSTGGMMADCDRNCNRGDTVTVDVRGVGIVHGVIAWRANGRIGIAFDEPIDPHLARKPVVPATQQHSVEADLERMRRPALRTL